MAIRRSYQQTAATLDAKLKSALAEARAAGLAAVNEFVKRREIGPDGLVVDSCGHAYLKVENPSINFRRALKRLDICTEALNGYWWVLSFSSEEMPLPANQSITAQERACEAAEKVMASYFPDECFCVMSRQD
jgi:hypothetical protein